MLYFSEVFIRRAMAEVEQLQKILIFQAGLINGPFIQSLYLFKINYFYKLRP
jgi:hypothetical protein